MRRRPRLTRLGVLGPKDLSTTRNVAAQLADRERLIKARVHPVNVLVALRTYASGQSARGDATWQPVSQVTDALDAAFYAAFAAVEPAGKRTMLALDVSGSMTQAVSGLPLSCREASAARQDSGSPDTAWVIDPDTSRASMVRFPAGSTAANAA